MVWLQKYISYHFVPAYFKPYPWLLDTSTLVWAPKLGAQKS
jgi:hypothetical protein